VLVISVVESYYFHQSIFVKIAPLKRDIYNHTNKILVRVIIACLIITFLRPQIVHRATDNYLENHGYQVCESRSKQWLHVRTIVYSKFISCDADIQ